MKDKRRQDSQQWTLSVKHSFNSENSCQGITLTTPLTSQVTRNMNTGERQFQPMDLIGQVEKYEQEEVNKVENVTISGENQTIMYSNRGQFVNGVYDLDLGEVTLNIPDINKLPKQMINGHLEWTLSVAPMKQN